VLYVSALEGHKALLRERLARARSAEQAVKTIVRTYVDWIAANPELARFVLYNRSVITGSEAASLLDRHNRTELAGLIAQVRQYVERGEVRRLPLDCYSAMLTGAAHDYARQWLNGRVRTALIDCREHFADAAWRVLRPEPARARKPAGPSY
jgi:hypothetical protein